MVTKGGAGSNGQTHLVEKSNEAGSGRGWPNREQSLLKEGEEGAAPNGMAIVPAKRDPPVESLIEETDKGRSARGMTARLPGISGMAFQ